MQINTDPQYGDVRDHAREAHRAFVGGDVDAGLARLHDIFRYRARLPAEGFGAPLHLLKSFALNVAHTMIRQEEVLSALGRVIDLCEAKLNGYGPPPYDEAAELSSVVVAERLPDSHDAMIAAAGLRSELQNLSPKSKPATETRKAIRESARAVFELFGQHHADVDLEPVRTYLRTWKAADLEPAVEAVNAAWDKASRAFCGDGKPKTGAQGRESAGAPPGLRQAVSPHLRHYSNAELHRRAESCVQQIAWYEQSMESAAGLAGELGSIFPGWRNWIERANLKRQGSEPTREGRHNQQRSEAVALHRRTMAYDFRRLKFARRQICADLEVIQAALDERPQWGHIPDVCEEARLAIIERRWRPTLGDLSKLQDATRLIAKVTAERANSEHNDRVRMAAEEFERSVHSLLAEQRLTQHVADAVREATPLVFHGFLTWGALSLYINLQERAELFNDKRIPNDVSKERADFLSVLLNFDKMGCSGITPEQATLDRDVSLAFIHTHLPPLIEPFNEPARPDYGVAKLMLRFLRQPNRSDAVKVREEIELLLGRELGRNRGNTSNTVGAVTADSPSIPTSEAATGNNAKTADLTEVDPQTPLGDGDWLMPPLSLVEMASRMKNITPEYARLILTPFALRRYLSRQKWTVRFDTGMPDETQRQLRQTRPK